MDPFKSGNNFKCFKEGDKWILEGDLNESGQLDFPIPHAANGVHTARRRLYLDSILANENGVLMFSAPGEFSSTVVPNTEVTIDFSNGQLKAELQRTDKTAPTQTGQIVLSERLVNSKGRFALVCTLLAAF